MHRTKKVFENVADFKAEVWRNADITELLEIDTPKSFCCIFHDDNSPSASIYFGDCGKWLYKCFSEFHHIGASAARDGHSCFLRMCMIHKVMY